MDYEKKYNEALERAKSWIKDGSEPSTKKCLELLFPELRESEDERIIKIIKRQMCHGAATPTDEERAMVDAWLEKQKEQKPVEKQDYSGLNDLERAILRGFLCAGVKNVPVGIIKETAQDCLAHFPVEWSEEDKRKLNRIYSIIGWAMDEHAFSSCKKLLGDKEGVELQDFLRSIAKPKAEWSEEDEKMRCNILNALTPNIVYTTGSGTRTGTSTYKYDKEIAWLKSLRPQPHWKPSEEQMEALQLAIELAEREREYGLQKDLVDFVEQLKQLM